MNNKRALVLLGNDLALASHLSQEREQGENSLKSIEIKKFQKSGGTAHAAKDKP